MEVEHLTLLGNSVIRETSDILPTTRSKLDIISMGYESKILTIPSLPFKIKITATPEGAAFDIMKGDELAVTNMCCFDEGHSQLILSHVDSIANMYRNAGLKVSISEPVTPQWLYSAVVNPLILSPSDLMMAGEVELYVYEQLYLAKKAK